eukprot:651215-Pelagomonas_calceolata.AAC.1
MLHAGPTATIVHSSASAATVAPHFCRPSSPVMLHAGTTATTLHSGASSSTAAAAAAAAATAAGGDGGRLNILLPPPPPPPSSAHVVWTACCKQIKKGTNKCHLSAAQESYGGSSTSESGLRATALMTSTKAWHAYLGGGGGGGSRMLSFESLAPGNAAVGPSPDQEASFSFGSLHQDGDASDSAQNKGPASESISEFLAAQLQRQRQQRAAEGVADSSDSRQPLTS